MGENLIINERKDEINNTKPRDFNNSYSKRWVFKDNSINNKTNKKKKDIDKIGTMIQIDHMKLFDRELGERFDDIAAEILDSTNLSTVFVDEVRGIVQDYNYDENKFNDDVLIAMRIIEDRYELFKDEEASYGNITY